MYLKATEDNAVGDGLGLGTGYVGAVFAHCSERTNSLESGAICLTPSSLID